MRATRYLFLLIAIYFLFLGGTSRYVTLYQVRVLHHIVMTGLLGLWLIQRIRRGKGLPSTPINLPLFAVIGVWFLSAVTSLDPRMAFEHIWFPFTYILMFFVVVDYFQRGRGKLIMEVFFFVMVIVIMMTGLEFASWYFGLGIMPNTDIGWFNVGILFPPSIPPASLALGISTLVAGFVVPCIFITATWAMTVGSKAHRRILWILAFLLFIVLIFTFSRGGLLAFICGSATFIIIRAIQQPKIVNRFSARVVGGVGGVIAIGIALLFVLVTLPFSIGQSDEGRMDMWRSAVQITVDHPLTGVGPGLFGRAYREYRNPFVGRDKLASAHNFYLNLASELGIVGIAVAGYLAVMLARASWNTWSAAKGRSQHLRVEGLVVALVALGIHSGVDVFTILPINLILVVIVAYLVTGHRTFLDPLPQGQITPAYGLLVITVIFGGVLLQWDRAQGLFQSSFGKSPADALPLIAEAQAIDPYLNLYHLHEAFVLGNQAKSSQEIETAIITYENVLRLEPTWDVGWINLAYLELQRDNPQLAYTYLKRADEIYPYNSAIFGMARIADEFDLESDGVVEDLYYTSLRRPVWSYPFNPLPLSQIWWSTPIASTATQRYVDVRNLEYQYRVNRVLRPELISKMIPEQPQTDIEWWVVGEYYREQGELDLAVDAFNQAISLNPTYGDYYVSRARAKIDGSEDVLSDLELAQLYGTKNEFPNTVYAQLADTEEEKISLQASALPIRSWGQEFASVLYTRPAIFDIPLSIQYPGFGDVTLQPWLNVAEYRLAQGDLDSAIRAYEFILSQSPYAIRAQEELERLRRN